VDGIFTNVGSAVDATANLKFIENESRGLAAKFDTYIDSEEGRVFKAEMGKLFKSGSVHYSEQAKKITLKGVASFSGVSFLWIRVIERIRMD
jgi:hypothetical protein